MSAFSVVMPAHDEAAVIDRSLRALMRDAQPGEIELVVVCNGCTDGTAAAAREAAPAARVIELAEASKAAALNAGDDAASAFPRFYLDADIAVSAVDLRAMAGLLESGEFQAVAATVLHKWRQSPSRVVRSYYRLWSALPAAGAGIFGTGVIGLQRNARLRFGQWPAVIADDYYCDSLFAADEKTRHPDVRVQLDVPSNLTSLVRRKARVRNGNLQVRAGGTGAAGQTRGGALRTVVRAHPALGLHAPAFLFVTLAARTLAAWDRRTGRSGSWRRDDSRISGMAAS